MKRCPTCNRTYADETITFCLDDGSLLSAPYDPDKTIPNTPRHSFESAPTEVLWSRSSASQRPSEPPIDSLASKPTSVYRHREGENNVLKYLLIGLLALFAGAGLFALLSTRVNNPVQQPVVPPQPNVTTSINPSTPITTASTNPINNQPNTLVERPNEIALQITEESVRTLMDLWVQAQNSRSFSTYQACYDPSFVGVKTVKNGHSQTYGYSSWMADRRKMLSQAINLSVQMTNVRIRINGDAAVVEFDQYYRSLKYSDWGPKEVRMKMTPSGARIVYEILKDSHPL